MSVYYNEIEGRFQEMNGTNPKNPICLLGPTGIGKTDLVLNLAEGCGEIINLDSMQLYRGMDIGTAKPTPDQQARVPHHLIDCYSPFDTVNVYDVIQQAHRIIQQIQQRGRIPFLVGGTGLYFKALFQGMFQGPTSQPAYRKEMEKEIQQYGLEPLYERLTQVDPYAAGKIKPQDRQRIIRALEVYDTTGKPLSYFWNQTQSPVYTFLKLGLKMERSVLYKRIETRCDAMIAAGLIDEVRDLIDQGLTLDHVPMKAIGYRHFYLYLRGEWSYEKTVELFKRDTRRFAKRQLTLFRPMEDVYWFPADESQQLYTFIQRHVFQNNPS
jgi:tRNA dimethylallyltransferase